VKVRKGRRDKGGACERSRAVDAGRERVIAEFSAV